MIFMDYKYLRILKIPRKEINQLTIILQVHKMISLSLFIQLMKDQKEVHNKLGQKICY